MPDPSLLNATGQRWRAALPPKLRDSHDYLAVIHAVSQEMERAEGCIEQVRLEFNPASATMLLNAWEYTFKLPVGGNGAPVQARRQKIIARMRKLLGQSEGRQWEAEITEIIGGGWSYEEHDPADGTSPADGVIRITLPFQTGTSRFLEAQTQIRELTAGHLDLEYTSVAGFQLDISEMDITDFGG